MAAVRRQLYVLGGNDLDYNNDRILVRHIDSYNMDLDQWTRCSFSLLTGGQSEENRSGDMYMQNYLSDSKQLVKLHDCVICLQKETV